MLHLSKLETFRCAGIGNVCGVSRNASAVKIDLICIGLE